MSRLSITASSSLSPPLPSSSTAKEQTTKNRGQTLLSLLRSIEKQSDKNTKQNEEELVAFLQELSNTFQRQGLLNGNTQRAAEIKSSNIFANASGDGGGGGGGKRGKKRKKGGGGGNNTSGLLGTFDGDGGGAEGSNASSTIEEVFLMTALSRIFGVGKSSSSLQYPSPAIVQAAADIILSIYEYTREKRPNENDADSCAAVECEILSLFGSKLLGGLGKTALHFLDNHKKEEGVLQAVVSCLRTCSSIILLSGTTLSRSTTALSNVKSAAWSCFNLHSDTLSFENVTKAASVLLATLPLAGNTNGDLPSDLWSDLVQTSISYLADTIRVSFPVRKVSSSSTSLQNKDKMESDEHNEYDTKSWSQKMQNIYTTQSKRIDAFTTRITTLSTLITSLLRFEGCDTNDVFYNFLSAAIPIKYILETIEIMLYFPTSSEARYNNTKSRLKNVVVENGLLSPKSAVEVANTVKYYGYEILNVLLGSIRNGGAALEYGRRIERMVLVGLQSGCSRALRRAVDDPGMMMSGSGGGKMKRRWLHASIPLRIKAVEAVKAAILALKSNAVVAHSDDVGGGGGSSSSNMCKAIVLVCGCLLEQISCLDEDNDFDQGDGYVVDNWGTVGERVALIDACAETISSCVATCGGYIPSNIRSTIDSVTYTCLSTLTNHEGQPVRILHASTKVFLLRLGINCICAPWSDGGTSSLGGIVRKTAAIFKSDRDDTVSSTAHSALCVLDALVTPRAPPLIIVSSRDSHAMPTSAPGLGMQMSRSVEQHGLSASAILEGIQVAKNEEVKKREQKRKESESTSMKEKTPEKERKKARNESKVDNGVTVSMKAVSSTTGEGDKSKYDPKKKEIVLKESKENVVNSGDDTSKARQNDSSAVDQEEKEETEVADTAIEIIKNNDDGKQPKDGESDTVEVEKQSMENGDVEESPDNDMPQITNGHMETSESIKNTKDVSSLRMNGDTLMEESTGVMDKDIAKGGSGDDDTDDDDAFPEIVDCEPDDDDL